VLDRVSDDAKTYLKGVCSCDSALSWALTAVERKVVVAKRWRVIRDLGKTEWGLVKVGNQKKSCKLATCQNGVEFADIWPMLNFRVLDM